MIIQAPAYALRSPMGLPHDSDETAQKILDSHPEFHGAIQLLNSLDPEP